MWVGNEEIADLYFNFIVFLDIIMLFKGMWSFMEYEFSSKEELFKRVKPALNAKKVELHRLGFTYINSVDIWNYLIEIKWTKGKNLMLSDIVDDIMHTDAKKIDEYLKGKVSKTRRAQYFDNNLEIL